MTTTPESTTKIPETAEARMEREGVEATAAAVAAAAERWKISPDGAAVLLAMRALPAPWWGGALEYGDGQLSWFLTVFIAYGEFQTYYGSIPVHHATLRSLVKRGLVEEVAPATYRLSAAAIAAAPAVPYAPSMGAFHRWLRTEREWAAECRRRR